MIQSLDTECTGLDLYHSANPFFVTMCREDYELKYWEWFVDPLTRQPIIPEGDLGEIQAELYKAEKLALQNSKFDVTALAQLGLKKFPWSKVLDTLRAGHLLASSQPHDLTTMALVYLGVNIQPLEDALEVATKEAQKIARERYPTWRIAKKGLPEMPSAKEKVWKYDSWLPRAIAWEEDYEPDHPWRTVLSDYGNGDSTVTVDLIKVQLAEIKRRGLEAIYYKTLEVLPVAYKMELRGITVIGENVRKLREDFTKRSLVAGDICRAIAKEYKGEGYEGGYALEIPKGANNKSLKTFVFDVMQVPIVEVTNKGEPSLDKFAIAEYLVHFDEGSREHNFFKNLVEKRKCGTSLSYMESYERFWQPLKV